MAQRCMMTGKGPSSGNNVSHSNRKTRRRFMPNLQTRRVLDPQTKKMVRMKVSTRWIKTQGKAA